MMIKKVNTYSAVGLGFLIAVLFIMTTASGILSAQASLDSLGSFWNLSPMQSNKDIRVISADSSGFLYISIWGEGIQRSTDGGTNWLNITNDLTNFNITAIEFDSTGRIFLGTSGAGIFYSTNNGNNWLQSNNGLTNLNISTLKIQRGGPMYAGTVGGGVFRSTDGAQTWTQKNTGLYYWEISAMIINNLGHVIVGTPRDGVYRSTDKGDNWVRSNGSITNRNITSFAMNSIGEIVVGTLGGGVCMSVDGGGNWVEIDNSPYCKNVNCLVFATVSSPVAGLTDNGIIRFDDQIYEEWVQTNYRNTGVNSITRTGTTLWAAIPLLGIYKSTNRGQNWTSTGAFQQNSMYLPVQGGKQNYVISTNVNGGVKISSNNGATWYDAGLADYNVTSFGLDSNGNFLVGTYNKSGIKYGTLFKSTDNGSNWVTMWTKKDSTITALATNPQGYVIAALSFPPIDPKNPNSIKSELYMTTNNGTSWQHIAASAQDLDGFKFISINYNGDIYLNQQFGLYKSTNLGADWSQVLNYTIATVTSVGFTTTRNVFCGTDLGIFKSSDHGFMWQTDDFGLQYPQVSNLIVTPHNEVIIGLSYAYGFLYSPNAGVNFIRQNFRTTHSTNKYLTQNKNGFIFASTSSIYRGVSPKSLAAPTLLLPAADAEGVEGRPTFTWNAAPNADLYEFQISTDQDFVNIKERVTIGALTHTLRYTLESFTLHYWRVRSRINNSLSDWSPVRVFTTTITPPILVSPENKSGSQNITNLRLIWHKVNGAGIYKVELAKDAAFTDIVVSKEIVDTSLVVAQLELYTKYYWRVLGKTFKATGPWSDVWEFYTKLRPPALRAPAHNSVAMPTIVKLEWNTSEGGTKYEVRLAKDSLFLKMVFEGLAENSNEQETKILENNTTYWWSVRSLNDDGNSDWSTPWKFTTVITAPMLVMPTNNSEDLKISQKFEWSQDTSATTYHIQISKDAGFASFFINDSMLTGYTLDVPNLDYFERYYWRVRKYVGNVPGLWSETWRLNTGLGKVALISPPNNSVDLGNDMVFIWDNLKGADEYSFELSEDFTFSNIASKINTKDTRHEILSLDYDKNYYFRVRGVYSLGVGDWSDAFTFKTKKFSSVEEPVAGLSNFTIYPNPSADNFMLDVVLTEDAEATLRISTADGILLAELHDGLLAQGNHKFSWKPDNLTQGSYLLTLNINGKLVTKQLILIK